MTKRLTPWKVTKDGKSDAPGLFRWLSAFASRISFHSLVNRKKVWGQFRLTGNLDELFLVKRSYLEG